METEQHANKQLLGQWKNQRRNFKKVPKDRWNWKYGMPKLMGCSKSFTKKKVYSDAGLPQETIKISN